MVNTLAIGTPVQFMGDSDQFAGAKGVVCLVHQSGRFDVEYDELPNVIEEQCLPEEWAVSA
jgi:hypothetical protein